MLQPVNPPPRVRAGVVELGPVAQNVPDLMDKYGGLDLSLSGTGCASLIRAHMWRAKLTSSLKGVARLNDLRDKLTGGIHVPKPKLIAIEGYSFGSPNGMARIGEWGGVARLVLLDLGIPFIEVPPTTLKKFVTGHGGGEKTHVVLELSKRWGIDEPDNDKADASGLALFALEFDQPGALPTLTKPQREAVDKFRKELSEGGTTRKKKAK